jgi:PAS domain S-box-containing protein
MDGQIRVDTRSDWGDMTDSSPASKEALHFQPEWCRVTLASIGDAVITTDPEGQITFLNPIAESLTGWALDEAAGQPLGNVFRSINEEGRQPLESPTIRALREGVVIGLANHTLLIAKDGTERPIDGSAAPIRNENGDVAGVVLVFRDISERRRWEKKTQEQAEALADLHRRKDEFLAMLSHELRNPLAPIMNALHLLRLQKNESQLQHQGRTVIERQVTQLTRLVDDLLEVSRITTGRLQLRHDRVVVSGIVERAVETARPLMDERRHELTVSLPPQPIWLHADAARLEQVVVNLLTNAAKYTDEGGHIWLTVQQESGVRDQESGVRDQGSSSLSADSCPLTPGEWCVLQVRDTGVGIAPDVLPRIFDLFTQAERSLDRSQGGLGIGLALVQRLVEMHRGRVEAHSSLGHGSEFVVRLPVVLTPALQPPLSSNETAEPPGPSLRVLVVDDNVDAAQSLAMLLKASRHQVRIVHDGPSVLEAALDYLPNVVLLDIGLPRMDGCEVAKHMRQQPVLKNVVLVAMTGFGQDSDRQRTLEAGFDHHLVKPADFDKLQQILATVAQKAK